ncbi:RusA family crossover junction endodeoxyribonuclease [Streptomyces sp. NPDC001552]|uniref:RusA family crossover junction endodeoxyribonuclease n=1 Tax=Streptomyces sp. NPDC001552 TaxID=3364587 RepID=UPI0036C4BD99
MTVTVVRVLAVSSNTRMDCGEEDTAHVWVRVTAWSPRRAFLTGAAPFAAAAGVPAAELTGRQFLADLDLDEVPVNGGPVGERLEWPGLVVAPKIPEQWGMGAAPPEGPPRLTAAAGRLLPAGGPDRDRERAGLLAQAIAPGAADVRVLVYDGPPASKARPRFTKEGGAYKSTKDRDAEQRTALRIKSAFPRPWTGNLALGCVFFRPDRQRVDVDNLLKHVCDAGNGIGWVDDEQITAVYGVAELDAARPRTLLVVARHLSSLDRSEPSGPRRGARRKGGGRT